MTRGIGAAIRDWAELGRVSNLPTVFSNVLAGGAVGALSAAAPIASGGESGRGAPLEVQAWLRLAVTGIAIAMLYIAGMILNDAADERIDRVQRPGRPIPSGRISRGAAVGAVIWLFIIGLALLGFLGWSALAWGLALAAMIVAYDLLHALHPGTVVLMGLCRGLAYAVAAASLAGNSIHWLTLGICGGTVTMYTILLTVIARSEDQQTLDRRKWLAIGLPVIAFIPLMVIVTGRGWILPTALAGPILVLWLARAARFVFAVPPRTRHAVMAWLAGISLVDALMVIWLGRPAWALAALACFAVTAAGHRKILGS